MYTLDSGVRGKDLDRSLYSVARRRVRCFEAFALSRFSSLCGNAAGCDILVVVMMVMLMMMVFGGDRAREGSSV